MMSKDVGSGSLLAPGHEAGGDWIHRADDEIGLERIEAFFTGRGYEMHRYDSYAIGRTLSGVQSFHYRGAVRNSPPGGTLVLHPDEKHDGLAGADGGFLYRMIYLETAAIQSVLGGRPLPFIHGGLSDDPRLFRAADRFLRRVDDRIGSFEYEDALYDLAHALDAAAGGRTLNRPRSVD